MAALGPHFTGCACWQPATPPLSCAPAPSAAKDPGVSTGLQAPSGQRRFPRSRLSPAAAVSIQTRPTRTTTLIDPGGLTNAAHLACTTRTTSARPVARHLPLTDLLRAPPRNLPRTAAGRQARSWYGHRPGMVFFRGKSPAHTTGGPPTSAGWRRRPGFERLDYTHLSNGGRMGQAVRHGSNTHHRLRISMISGSLLHHPTGETLTDAQPRRLTTTTTQTTNLGTAPSDLMT